MNVPLQRFAVSRRLDAWNRLPTLKWPCASAAAVAEVDSACNTGTSIEKNPINYDVKNNQN